MAFKTFRCGVCGGRVKLVAKRGRTREYRRGVDLPVPADFQIPTCDACGEEYLTVAMSEALDARQAPEYAAWQAAHCKRVFARIRERHRATLREVEDACGVTRTYLSHVLSGTKEASATLLALLEAFSLAPHEFERRRSGITWEAADASLRATLTSEPADGAYTPETSPSVTTETPGSLAA